MRRFFRPEVPFIAGGHPCACMSRCWFRGRSRDGFRYGSALSAWSLETLPVPLSRHRSYPSLDPRPRTSSRSTLSRGPSTCASLDQATAHRFLPLHFRRTDTPSSLRFSLRWDRALRHDLEPCTRVPQSFYGLEASPSRRRIASAASRDSSSETASTALQTRCELRFRKPSPDQDAACGRRLDPTIICGDGRWTTAMNCTGRVALSEGSPLEPPAAAERTG